MRVLIACEYSGAVRDEFIKLGHDAMSCDLLPTDAPGPHYEGDVFDIINDGWDMMIAFPPCTHLALSGAMHFEKKRLDGRQEEGLKFVKDLMNANIPKIAIENPIGIVSSRYRKPDQIVQPYMFGDEATKTTCLWLYGLPHLKATKIVGKGERIKFSSGKSQPKWYSDAFVKAKSPEERRTLRSKTFPGLAKEMAKQWTK